MKVNKRKIVIMSGKEKEKNPNGWKEVRKLFKWIETKKKESCI